MQLRNWAGNVEFGARHLHAPDSIEQLQDLVSGAQRIRPLGAGHSFTAIADTAGELVSLHELPRDIEVDGDTARVPAGVRYAEIADVLDAHGKALHNLASLPHITVAGACTTATHGSGVRNQCLAGSVTAVEFVRADGELVTVRRGDDTFAGCVVTLGALGVITHLSLATQPAYELRQQVYVDAPLEAVLDRLDDVLAAGYSVSLFSRPGRADVIDQVWVKTDGALPDAAALGAQPSRAQLHPIANHDPAAATDQLGVPGPWHARLPHFRAEFTPSAGAERQSEFLLPRRHGAAAIRAVHTLRLQHVLQVAEFRTVAADDLWLSPCYERDTIGVHFTWTADDVAVLDALAQVERALEPYEPRPHWAKLFRTSPEAVRASYPRLTEFQGLAATHDPDRKFGNPFLERFVY